MGSKLQGTTIDVTPPQGLEALAPAYLEKRRTDAGQLRAWLEVNQMEDIRALAHNIKGTGSSYGFAPLTEIGRELEQAAQQDDAAQVSRELDRMDSYLHRVRLVA